VNGFDSIWSDTNFGIIFHIVKVSTWLNYFLDKEHIFAQYRRLAFSRGLALIN
jgi:hypothetical protein